MHCATSSNPSHPTSQQLQSDFFIMRGKVSFEEAFEIPALADSSSAQAAL
jgi:hypothetical protein